MGPKSGGNLQPKQIVLFALAGLALVRQTTAQAPPSLAEARKATYKGLRMAAGRSVTLMDGKWDGTNRSTVTLVRDFLISGDLDVDGVDETIVLLVEHGRGTGEFVSVAVLKRVGGAIRNTGTAFLGDRVQVRSIRITPRKLVADLVQAGPGDAMCCPGEIVERSWDYSAAGLKESGGPIEQGRLSPDALAGTEWVLRSWKMDTPAPSEPVVTLSFNPGQFSGRSGCNSYFAGVTTGGSPGELKVGPAGSTQMACPEPVMEVESRYLRQLRAVSRLGFMATRLMLTYQTDGEGQVMLFEEKRKR
jgi:heat shock protein HslJ